MQVGYCPALMNFYDLLTSNAKEKKTGIQYLERAIKYEYPPALFRIGFDLLLVNEKKAFGFLEQAAAGGSYEAEALIGALYSPVSGLKFSKKDATEAVKHLKASLEIEKNPGAYHHLGLLYYTGMGVKKDKILAERYQRQALRFNPNLPPLKEQGLSIFQRIIVTIGFSLMSFGVGFVFSKVMY